MFRVREDRPAGKHTLADLEEWAAQIAETMNQVDLDRDHVPVWLNGRYYLLREIAIRFKPDDAGELFDLPGPWDSKPPRKGG